MKVYFKKVSIIICTLTLFTTLACSKDEEEIINTNPKENFLNLFLDIAEITPASSINGSSFHEFGVLFQPLENGKITDLVVKLPTANNNLRVTLWNKSDGSILRTEFLNFDNPDVSKTFDIADVELNKDSFYLITMNSNSFYFRSSLRQRINYPITVDNISILGSAFDTGTEQIMPLSNIPTRYFGDLSFNFQKN